MKQLISFLFISLSPGLVLAAGNPYLNLTARACPEGVVAVPPGNHEEFMPELPTFTVGRVAMFDRVLLKNGANAESTQQVVAYARSKYPKVIAALRKEGLLAEINVVAKKYGVDPLHLLAPILGEKVFNGFIDAALQDSISNFLKSDLDRISRDVRELAKKPEVQECMKAPISNYWKWQCAVFYNADERGNPLQARVKKAGTCGIAQFNPVLLWSLNDVVARQGGLAPIAFGDVRSSLATVLNPRQILHYLAAYSLTVQQVYKDVACMDISKNVGIVASLYNVGGEYARAFNLAQYRKYSPGENRLPQENYFGWFINYFEKELREELRK